MSTLQSDQPRINSLQTTQPANETSYSPEDTPASKERQRVIFIDTTKIDCEIAETFVENKLQDGNYRREFLGNQSDPVEVFNRLESILIDQCDESFIIYQNAPLSWLYERFRFYKKIQVKRIFKQKPKLVIHICSSKDQIKSLQKQHNDVSKDWKFINLESGKEIII